VGGAIAESAIGNTAATRALTSLCARRRVAAPHHEFEFSFGIFNVAAAQPGVPILDSFETFGGRSFCVRASLISLLLKHCCSTKESLSILYLRIQGEGPITLNFARFTQFAFASL
jgi:hypothetical protein